MIEDPHKNGNVSEFSCTKCHVPFEQVRVIYWGNIVNMVLSGIRDMYIYLYILISCVDTGSLTSFTVVFACLYEGKNYFSYYFELVLVNVSVAQTD